MNRSLPVLGLILLTLTACATSHPEPVPVHPVVAGAVEGAIVGRNIGRAAGVIAAVLGGSGTESLDEALDRYRRLRDAGTVIGAVIGAANGASEEAARNDVFADQFRDLRDVPGVEVSRPAANRIELRFAGVPDHKTLARIAAILVSGPQRAIDIDGPADAALDVREALIELGLPPSTINAHRVDTPTLLIHIRP